MATRYYDKFLADGAEEVPGCTSTNEEKEVAFEKSREAKNRANFLQACLDGQDKCFLCNIL